jgi:hypothetical protein
MLQTHANDTSFTTKAGSIMAEPSKAAQSGIAGIAGIGGAVIGLVAGRYLGMNLLIPGGIAVLVGWILTKTLPPRVKPMIAAVAIFSGHASWMAFGVLYALGQGDTQLMIVAAIEVAVLIGAAVWLAVRPSLVAVIVVGLFQLIAIGVNAYHLSGMTFGTTAHRALPAHVLLRVASLIAMIVGLVILRRAAVAAAPAFPVVHEPAA